MTSRDLSDRLNDVPFKPFRIETTLNDVYEIRERWMIWVGESSATIAIETQADARADELVQRFRTVALSHMFRDRRPRPAEGQGPQVGVSGRPAGTGVP